MTNSKEIDTLIVVVVEPGIGFSLGVGIGKARECLKGGVT